MSRHRSVAVQSEVIDDEAGSFAEPEQKPAPRRRKPVGDIAEAVGGVAQAKGFEPPKVTTILVKGRSAMPKTMPDNVRYGHWRAGIHWPGEGQKTERVSPRQLDELLADQNLSITYDESEADEARKNASPIEEAKSLAKRAAEAELEAAKLREQQALAELAAKADEAAKMRRDAERRLASVG